MTGLLDEYPLNPNLVRQGARIRANRPPAPWPTIHAASEVLLPQSLADVGMEAALAVPMPLPARVAVGAGSLLLGDPSEAQAGPVDRLVTRAARGASRSRAATERAADAGWGSGLLSTPALPNRDYGAEVLRLRGEQLDLPMNRRIQPDPSDPAFDATPTPALLPGVPQGQMQPMRRLDPAEAHPLDDRIRPLITHREAVADRMAADLTPQLGHDTQYFYHMRPLYDALRQDGASHDEALRFIQRDFAPTNAGTSPRTNTQQNLLNTSFLQYRAAQGLPNTEGALRSGQRGYGMIYGTHPRMVQGLLDGTHDVGANPKPYYFGGNIGGDLAYTTADTHAIRAATGTLNEIRPGILHPSMLAPDARAPYAADPSSLNWATGINDSLQGKTLRGQSFQPEYPVFHDVFEGVGQRLGIPTADAQSLAWFHYGNRTGLESAPRSIPQLLNERLSVTAQALGINPRQAFSLWRRGEIPLMAGAGLAATPGLLEARDE